MIESLPESFQVRMQHQLQSEYQHFIDALQKVSPTSIRINPLKGSGDFYDQTVPWAEKGRYLSERPVFTLDPAFHAGTYYVQEASSMFLEQAVKKCIDLTKPVRALDLCAAPGGKSTHLLSLLHKDSLIVSNEVIRSRSGILSENIQKWGYANTIVTNNDPEHFGALENFFDIIVIDAPCSGEGLFRKDPMAVNQWSEENVNLCAARQKRILHDIWPSLKENGIIIYCTCTYNEQENEENLTYLSKEHPIEFIDLMPDPAWNIATVRKSDTIGYKFYPHKVKGEGFFLSAMRKKEGDEARKLKSKVKLTFAATKITERLNDWIPDAAQFKFVQHQELIFAFPSMHIPEFELILQHLKVVYAGVNLATLKHDKTVPEHSLAVSTIINRENFPIAELTREDALQYLRREAINLPEGNKGYTLVSYDNNLLGWVNALPNRSNNMYPQEWRIRMAQF